MADPIMHSSADRQQAVLVTFAWGDPTWPGLPGQSQAARPEGGVARYTDSAAAIVSDGKVYLPLPALRVEAVESDGGAEDKPFRVSLPGGDGTAQSVEPFRTVARTKVRIDVRVEVCDPAAPNASDGGREEVARGWVAAWTRGRSAGAVELECATAKRMLTRACGLKCDAACAWTLGDAQCAVDLSGYTFRGRVTAVSRRVITCSALNTTPTVGAITLPAGWARFGKAVRGGLSIPIVDHSGANATLRWEAPASWANAWVSIVAGCDKSVAVCRARFANEGRYGGFGSAIPAYQPLVTGGA